MDGRRREAGRQGAARRGPRSGCGDPRRGSGRGKRWSPEGRDKRKGGVESPGKWRGVPLEIRRSLPRASWGRGLSGGKTLAQPLGTRGGGFGEAPSGAPLASRRARGGESRLAVRCSGLPDFALILPRKLRRSRSSSPLPSEESGLRGQRSLLGARLWACWHQAEIPRALGRVGILAPGAS